MSRLDETRRLFTALSDPTRLRLFALCRHGEHSVKDLQRVLNQSQPRVSRHLKVLTEAGLLERYRDGHFVYYRVPSGGELAQQIRLLWQLLPAESAQLRRDMQRADRHLAAVKILVGEPLREFNQALLDFSLGRKLGRLLDMGSGTGRVLTVLGRQAVEGIGIDHANSQRSESRERLRVAGLTNCTVRNGDVAQLEYPDRSFDTIVIDDVLTPSSDGEAIIAEAARLLSADGRVLIIASPASFAGVQTCREYVIAAVNGHLQLASPRPIPPVDRPSFLFFNGNLAGAASAVA